MSAALVCSATGADAAGHVKQYHTTTWHTDDGLPQESVTRILQTHDGYIWVATLGGLARFDGVKFTVFNAKDYPGLVSNSIHDICEDPAGNLWIQANNGLSRYQDGVFTDFTPAEARSGDYVDKIWIGQDGHLMVASEHSFYRYDGGRLERLFNSKYSVDLDPWISPAELSDGTIVLGYLYGKLGIYQGGQFRVVGDPSRLGVGPVRVASDGISTWVGASTGLFLLDHNKLVRALPASALGPNGISALSIDRSGRLWMISNGALFEYADLHLTKFGAAQGFSSTIYSLSTDNSGSEIVQCADGVARFSSGEFEHYNVCGANTIGTPPTFLVDNESNFWIGGDDSGLSCLKNLRWHTYGTSEGGAAGGAISVYRDHTGRLWVGEAYGVARLVNNKLVRLSYHSWGPTASNTTVTYHALEHLATMPFSVPAGDLSNRSITSITEGPDGDMWFTDGSIVYRLTKRGLEDYTSVLGLVAGTRGGLCTGPHGSIYVLSADGIIRYARGVVTRLESLSGFPSLASSPEVLCAGKSGIWVGMAQGVLQYTSGKFVFWGAKDGLPNMPVVDVFEDSKKSVWLGVWGGGIYRFAKGRFAAITKKNGLFSDSVHQLAEDARGNFWVGSGDGVFRVSADDLNASADGSKTPVRCYPYDTSDGALGGASVAGTQPSICRDPDGAIWFATVGGLERVRTQLGQVGPPSILIESVSAGGKVLPAGMRATVPPGTKSLEFQYTALSYFAPQKLQFMYKLDGFDTDWVNATNRRVADYTNIPPGHYVFRVRACNEDGIWSETLSGYQIDIQPTINQTWWFKTGCVLLIFAIIFGWYKQRTYTLKLRNAALEKKVADRTKELTTMNFELVAMQEEVYAQNDELQCIQLELEAQNEELRDTQEHLAAQNEELYAVKTVLENKNDALANANERLANLATTDGLTGLKNHRAFQERLEDEFERSRRYPYALSVVLMDVDNFKYYNDKFGHPAGDEVLKRVAGLLQQSARDADYVARYGGEEFIIILPHTDSAGAIAAAERFRIAIESADWPNRNVTASFGVAEMEPSTPNCAALISASDEALYASKHDGRNRVTLAGQQPIASVAA